MDVDNILEQAWIYRSWQELNGAPFVGTLNTHDGGGYSAELGVNQETASFIVEHLYRNAWIDHAATITFVEFTIYNTNTNLFTQVRHTLPDPFIMRQCKLHRLEITVEN